MSQEKIDLAVPSELEREVSIGVTAGIRDFVGTYPDAIPPEGRGSLHKRLVGAITGHLKQWGERAIDKAQEATILDLRKELQKVRTAKNRAQKAHKLMAVAAGKADPSILGDDYEAVFLTILEKAAVVEALAAVELFIGNDKTFQDVQQKFLD